MTEPDIHCNVVKCRKPLSAEQRKSVLAGLKPDIILDVCARAIAFYEYQTSQELAFRAVIQKSTQEKYNEEKQKEKIATKYSKLEDKTNSFKSYRSICLKRKTVGPNIQSTFTNQPPRPPMNRAEPMIYNPMRFNNQQQTDEDDIISRIGRSSSTNRSIFNLSDRNSPSRIPSPVKSIYSVRSHRPKYYKKTYKSHYFTNLDTSPPLAIPCTPLVFNHSLMHMIVYFHLKEF
ncbi:uncharacterized protein EV154DRAFT_531677 [Mucor mucedo]|uniref:uncharacterized protein n=1 Tax=Mucor mucedo TaxID=29922 RepID=UPI002220BA6A|nr:uncharacterized protein EV154DRAFT_531677 [Mucor mucedo]KAI7867884.1 hypothetical protein EV154DRAFT_531677 [Mucor mucedo]